MILTFTFELFDLHVVKMNQHARYVGRRSFISKVTTVNIYI